MYMLIYYTNTDILSFDSIQFSPSTRLYIITVRR